MDNLEKAIIGASLMNTLFQEYNPGELASGGEMIRKRVGKFMRQRAKTNRGIFMRGIKSTDTAWRATINRFAEDKIKIEAKATIMAIYNFMPEVFEKFISIKDKHIEKFMIGSIDDADAEHNSDKVIEYLMGELGIDVKKSSFKLQGIKNDD